MRTVLVVEDDYRYYRIIKREFAGAVKLIRAKTINQARASFRDNSDIDLIIMDACVPGAVPNTTPLVREIIESGYSKPIIAASGIMPFSYELIEAGATHYAKKEEAAKLALELLSKQ